MYAVLAIDIETSGFEPPAVPIEFGSCGLFEEGGLDLPTSFLMNIKPDAEPNYSAIAVHHITDDMLVGAKNRDEAVDAMREAMAGAPFVAAHKASFEMQWLKHLTPARWICTWKVACCLYPDLKEHNLQFLRYALKLDCDPELAMPPHRAAPDAYVCARLLQHFVHKGLTFANMAQLSAKPCLLPFITFGNHIGERWYDVPRSYLEWVEKNIKDDEDIQFTVKRWLYERRT